MKCKKRRRRRTASRAVACVIVVLLVAVGRPSESTESAGEAAAAEFTVESPWDGEPVEPLQPAARPERTPKQYSWERQYARTDAKGNLTWTPMPFVFKAGDSLRYIDFAEGSDSNDGRTRSTAWKHHPWGSAATGREIRYRR